MQFNHWNSVEACLLTDTNLIGSSGWFAVSFHSAVAISFVWWPRKPTEGRWANQWKCALWDKQPINSNWIAVLIWVVFFEAINVKVRQTYQVSSRGNSFNHIVLSSYTTTAIISHYFEEFSPGNLGRCCQSASNTTPVALILVSVHILARVLMWTDADW